MYFFVRFTGIVAIVFGTILMLAGVAAAVYGFVQYNALADLFENYVLLGSNQTLPDPRVLFSFGGLLMFLGGMFTAAMGQLLLVFADLASQARETNVILRGIKRLG